jgi:hypothetical protein
MKWKRRLLSLIVLACVSSIGCSSVDQRWKDFKEWKDDYIRELRD